MEQDLIPPSIADNLPVMVRNELVKLPAQKQEGFLDEYKVKVKSIVAAYVFWLLFGLFHYVYLRKWGLQIFFWLTLGGFFIWWIVDFFRIAGMVRNYNKDVAVDVLRNLKAVSG